MARHASTRPARALVDIGGSPSSGRPYRWGPTKPLASRVVLVGGASLVALLTTNWLPAAVIAVVLAPPWPAGGVGR